MKKRKPSDPRSETPVTFGSALRKWREDAGLSVAEMAHKLGVSPPHLSRLERDEIAHPSASLLLRITKCYGMQPENLYALTGVLVPTDLPDLIPYLHAKHPDWPDLMIVELDHYCGYLETKYSVH